MILFNCHRIKFHLYLHNSVGQVTFVEALDQLMPGFDPEIAKLAQRILINPRKIDYHTGVFASKVSSNFNLALRAMYIFWTYCLIYSLKHLCR